MNVTREKSDIFAQIAALRVSSEGYPKFSNTNSIDSISQETNSLDFLLDLTKSLIGFEPLKEGLIDVLTHNLEDIELDVKKALKEALKSLVSCSINPSLPDSFVQDGITLEIDRVDLLDKFKVNPNSGAGKLLYNDVNSGTNSTDFNTFLYEVIQDNGGTSSWGNQTLGEDILNIRFTQNATTSNGNNNTLNIKPSSNYEDSKLTDINNDYIDSIKLFETNKLINSVIESLFGSISLNTSKNKNTIENEIKIQEIIDRVINLDEEEIVDNSFFQFSNEELSNIESKAEMKRKGKRLITTCDNVESEISFESIKSLDSELDEFNTQTVTPQLIERKTRIVRNALDSLAEESASNVDSRDRYNVKVNLIEEMLRNIMNSIVGVILSPKLIGILALNHLIVYGETFKDIEEFMIKNKSLLTSVLRTIRDSVVSILLERVLKEIKTLVADNIIRTQVERVKYSQAQLSSLVGVDTEILRNISGLT
jgi:hypothetical protein